MTYEPRDETEKFKDMINFHTYPSIEAQISAISDDIAYNNHDIQDGIKANLFKRKSQLDINKIQFCKINQTN